MRLKISVIMCVVLVLSLLQGCQKNNDDAKTNFSIYYVSTEGKGLEAVPYVLKTQELDKQVEEVFEELKNKQESRGITSSVPSDITLEKYELSEGQLNLYFGTSYLNMKKGTEILMRAAVVQTMVQLQGVNYVAFYVDNEALKDSYGEVIGIMNAENFIQKTDSEIASYQSTSLKLYFATADGTMLKQEERAEVHYNENTSVEKLVLEQLLTGPQSEGLGRTISDTVKLLGVSVKDGVCYVNLSSNFLTNIYNQKPEVTVYSIVNSIIENAKVLKVQILIEGSSDVLFLNTVDFSQPLEWNEEILEVKEQS